MNNIHPAVNPPHSNVPHSEVPPGAPAPVPRVSREPRLNNTYMSHTGSGHPTTLENGLPPDPSPPAAASLSQYQLRGSLVAPQPSPTIRYMYMSFLRFSGTWCRFILCYSCLTTCLIFPYRHSPAGGGYLQPGQASNIVSPASANSGVVRNSSVTPDPLRGVPR